MCKIAASGQAIFINHNRSMDEEVIKLLTYYLHSHYTGDNHIMIQLYHIVVNNKS